MYRPFRALAVFLFVLATVFTSACAPRPDPEKAAEMARVFGECSLKLNAKMLDLPTLSASDPRQQMIQKIVDELIASRYQQFPWKVNTVLFDYPIPNAFTTGGGFLAAFSGVYAMADDEAALAGVIAHELAHMAKSDPLELASYLEQMLAASLQQSGMGDEYESGQAIKTITDFCLAIPGLVSVNWKKDLVTETNDNVHPELNDEAVPYVPFTFSQNPDSPYYHLTRDPDGRGRNSACNNAEREVHDEFVVINPDYYFTSFPNAAALPPIPDDITSSMGGLPGVGALWSVSPWVAFQHTALARYVECQSDEAGMLNLLASGYNPLALNQSFVSVLNLLGNEDPTTDWRFVNHPSLGQRIEDNQTFITHNSDVMPTLSALQDPNAPYLKYKVLADQVEAFENIRDTARAAILNPLVTTTHSNAEQRLQHFEPVTLADIVVLLNKELSKHTAVATASSSQRQAMRCQAFANVYKSLTGEDTTRCLPVD